MTIGVTIGGIVLAAGASRRASGPKALGRIDGETLVARALRTLREGGCGELVVVVGAPYGAQIAAAVPTDCVVLVNDEPSRGMLSSLKIALASAPAWDAAVVSLVDQPRVAPATVRQLVDAWRRSDADVARPRYGARTGHPYVLSRRAVAPLLAAPDEEGARPVLAALRRVDVEIDDPFVLEDLDTLEALAAAGVDAIRPKGVSKPVRTTGRSTPVVRAGIRERAPE